MNYQTSDGTAVAGEDYDAASGTIVRTGVTSQTIHFHIHTDTADESDETLTVTLSGPSGVTVARGTATGTILNDDAPQSIVSSCRSPMLPCKRATAGPSRWSSTSISAPAQGVVTVDYHTEDLPPRQEPTTRLSRAC